jgi:hypothetical protein
MRNLRLVLGSLVCATEAIGTLYPLITVGRRGTVMMAYGENLVPWPSMGRDRHKYRPGSVHLYEVRFENDRHLTLVSDAEIAPID